MEDIFYQADGTSHSRGWIVSQDAELTLLGQNEVTNISGPNFSDVAPPYYGYATKGEVTVGDSNNPTIEPGENKVKMHVTVSYVIER